MDKNSDGIAVLMYHYVYTKDDIPDSLNSNYILDTDLEAQLQYLSENNYCFPSYQELAAYVKGELTLPEKSVILTFDDGQKGFLNYGIPLLEKYQIPATSFVIAS
ncbi:MAG: polysaccharide deacetylase family protein [Erysipelotrichaceae bacterium]|nr:polysaccharide deacetylase family protein [Erysipelotrichaceae bacterium]